MKRATKQRKPLFAISVKSKVKAGGRVSSL